MAGIHVLNTEENTYLPHHLHAIYKLCFYMLVNFIKWPSLNINKKIRYHRGKLKLVAAELKRPTERAIHMVLQERILITRQS